MDELYGFNPPPRPADPEWMGTQIGVSNMITRARGRGGVADRTIDARAGKLESLLDSCKRAMAGRDLFINDAVIHGVRVRATTDSFHLADFWRENWFNPQEWLQATGFRAPDEPQVHAYAFTRIPEEPEGAYYSRKNHSIVSFNTSYYGQLRGWALGAVGRILGEESGIHLIQGAAGQLGGRGALFIAPMGAGKSTCAYGLMDFPGARLHSDDVAFVRYGYRRPSGQIVSPIEIKGAGVRGAACFRWLETNPGKNPAVVVRSLDHERFEVPASDLALDTLGAYAFAGEKNFYVRTNVLLSFPAFFEAMMRSRLENVPVVSLELLSQQAPTLDALIPLAGRSSLPGERRREAFLRLCASESSRAMLSPAAVFGRDRIFADPLEPLKLDAVFLLKRNPDDPGVSESLAPEGLCSRLMTSDPVACNAYRAGDERSEAEYTQMLEAVRERTRAASIFSVHDGIPASRSEKPASFQAEFDLFRQLGRSTRAFDLNTAHSKKSSARLAARILESLPRDLSLAAPDLERYLK